jgi:hypothetical protein
MGNAYAIFVFFIWAGFWYVEYINNSVRNIIDMKAKEIEKKFKKLPIRLLPNTGRKKSFFSVLTRGGNRTKTAIWIFHHQKTDDPMLKRIVDVDRLFCGAILRWIFGLHSRSSQKRRRWEINLWQIF